MHNSNVSTRKSNASNAALISQSPTFVKIATLVLDVHIRAVDIFEKERNQMPLSKEEKLSEIYYTTFKSLKKEGKSLSEIQELLKELMELISHQTVYNIFHYELAETDQEKLEVLDLESLSWDFQGLLVDTALAIPAVKHAVLCRDFSTLSPSISKEVSRELEVERGVIWLVKMKDFYSFKFDVEVFSSFEEAASFAEKHGVGKENIFKKSMKT